VAGGWWLVTGCWLLVAGGWLLVTCYLFSGLSDYQTTSNLNQVPISTNTEKK